MVNLGQFKKGDIPWNKGIKKEIDFDFIKEKYLSGYSTIEIGKILNISDKTIASRLKEIGVKLRKNSELPKRIKQKIRDTMIKKGIQPKERYSGEPWNKGLKGVQVPWNKGKRTGQKNWKNRTFTEETIRKIKEARAKQIFPVKDSSIEIKIQNYLKRLGIEFYTHNYISEIKNAYQCDIFIPKQAGIYKKTIIECFGDYWHNFPYGREIDNKRTLQLRKKGFRVLVFWECEIKDMPIEILKQKL